MFCMKKLRFSSHPRTKVRHQGPLGSARAQPWIKTVSWKPTRKCFFLMLHFHQQNCKNRVSFRFKFQNIILSSMLPNSPHTALQAATILVNMASKKIWRLNFQLKLPIWWPEFDSQERRYKKFLYLLVLMVSPKLNWDKHRTVVKGRGPGVSPGY